MLNCLSEFVGSGWNCGRWFGAAAAIASSFVVFVFGIDGSGCDEEAFGVGKEFGDGLSISL